MITLTENLLDITNATVEIKIEQFDLNDVISNAMADCRSQIKKDKIKIRLISEAKDVFVKADKTRIYQVITT